MTSAFQKLLDAMNQTTPLLLILDQANQKPHPNTYILHFLKLLPNNLRLTIDFDNNNKLSF